jgi:hypothetical protein
MQSETQQGDAPDRLKGRRVPYAVIALLVLGVPALFGWWVSAAWAVVRLFEALAGLL